jgi:uncharacterized membrane protein YciS (DUF1049 family)
VKTLVLYVTAIVVLIMTFIAGQAFENGTISTWPAYVAVMKFRIHTRLAVLFGQPPPESV